MSIQARFRFSLEQFRLDVDLDLPGRGITALFGPSGCGKTSLLRAIAGLDRHTGCRLQVGNECWQDERRFLEPHRRPIGYVFQEASLFEHLDVAGNLQYGLKRVPVAEQRISLDRAIALLGIGGLLTRRPATLSGGERQRVAIARALAVSPRLLLMDEPLAAVDLERRQEILPWIESLHQELDIPILYVSHSPEEVARLADHLVLLRAGRSVASGDVHELFTRLDLPLALDPDATAVLEATVDGHDEEYRLTRLGCAAGELTRGGQPGAAAPGRPRRQPDPAAANRHQHPQYPAGDRRRAVAGRPGPGDGAPAGAFHAPLGPHHAQVRAGTRPAARHAVVRPGQGHRAAALRLP